MYLRKLVSDGSMECMLVKSLRIDIISLCLGYFFLLRSVEYAVCVGLIWKFFPLFHIVSIV